MLHYASMVRLPVVIFLIAALVLAVVHNVAIALYLYWRYLWLDIPMHVLGGAVVALSLYAGREFGVIQERWLRFIPILGTVFTVAVLWEIYEVLIGIPMESNYVVDTILDMLMGMLGGVIGYVVGNAMAELK